MSIHTEEYGLGTSFTSNGFTGFIAARVMCSDGIVRATKRIAASADTYFSVPASVAVKGKTVAGFLMVETAEGYSTETPEDRTVVKFVAYKNRKNSYLLPGLAWKRK